MWWQRRDVAIAIRCAEASFGITREDKAWFVESVEIFKYLGGMLDH